MGQDRGQLSRVFLHSFKFDTGCQWISHRHPFFVFTRGEMESFDYAEIMTVAGVALRLVPVACHGDVIAETADGDMD